MYRYHDSRHHAGQHIAEDSAARDNLQQKTMELIEELHDAETNCVCEQCQARTSQLGGTLTQTTLLVIKSHVIGFRTETANVMNRGAMFHPTAGKQARHISYTKGKM